MDVTNIVKDWLNSHPEYDGLCEEDGECGCASDDLAPCGEINGNCVAGHKIPCPHLNDTEESCEWECKEGDWHIQRGPCNEMRKQDEARSRNQT